jgi:hypothetical protein
MKSSLQNKITIKNTIKNTLASPAIIKAIEAYDLKRFVYTQVPPTKYVSGKTRSVEVSIQVLNYNRLLQPILQSIPTRSGAHPGKGLPSKTSLVETLYGLDRYHRKQIEKADFSWFDKAVEEARTTKTPTSVAKMMKLKKQYEDEQKAIERKREKDAKAAEFAAKVENAKKASSDETFGAAVVDLTFAPEDFDFSSVSLPMAENSLMLMAVRPKDMKKALDIIDLWQFSYIDNVIWNRDFSKPGSCWSDNKHTVILIASNGNPEKPMEGFKLNSVHYERQTSRTVYIPDYYYDMIEQMCPGLQYLEVFSHRKHSDSWHIFDTNSDNN